MTFCFVMNALSAQTGSIRGVIKSAKNHTGLQGSNVLLLSTNIGSVSDSNGVYIIPNVSPGKYSVKANHIGYKKTTIKNIAVYSRQTTVINFMLEEEVLDTDEITIYAERGMINPEISTSLINIDAKNIENIPISSIEEAISLQAGIEPNMT
ncbi:MAG: carboxypeptidase-like regulatory domain-containing protein, partial [Candidatus Neomarinimicrobiota bacterium]|nr:carboxypeptidase-like regulatory domain-containing protein [Candidatus Neomarinimicrobiota bacterium]